MDFVETIAPGAIAEWEKHRILPSLTIAQGILETGRGTSELATKANNLFGVKGDYDGYAYFKNTTEYIDGKAQTVRAAFKHYPDWSASLADHSQVFVGSDWRKENYQHVIGETDPEKAVAAILPPLAPAGYATDPNYKQKILQIIQAEDLTRFDKQAGAVPAEPPEKTPEPPAPTPKPEPPQEVRPVSEKSIIIDPGHGGIDPGAYGHGVNEKDWTLRISLYEYRRLQEMGARVGITRTTDQTLDSVPRTDKVKGYDYCISNHWNAFNGQANGIETIYNFNKPATFAADLAEALRGATGLPIRRVFTRKNEYGTNYYFMHRLTNATNTVIIEHGFIDNAGDNAWYKNDANFTRAAEAVLRVVCRHIGLTYREPGAIVPAGSATTGATKGTLYRVQVGAFGKLENAQALQQTLEANGIDTYLIQENGLYKVQAGAFGQKENAEAQANRIRALGHNTYITTAAAQAAVAPAPAAGPPSLTPGARVRLRPQATHYATGEAIPRSLVDQVYTIQEVGNGRVLLQELYSWVVNHDLIAP